jgi:hypothetical protein
MNLKLQFPKSNKSPIVDKTMEENSTQQIVESPINVESMQTVNVETATAIETIPEIINETPIVENSVTKTIVIDVKPNEVIEIDLVVTITNFQLPKQEIKSGMPAYKLSISGAHKAVLIVNKWPIANRQNITLMIAVAQELSKKLSGVGGTKQKVNIRDEAKNLICSVTLNEIEWMPQYKNVQREFNPQDSIVKQIKDLLNPKTEINSDSLENEMIRVFE